MVTAPCELAHVLLTPMVQRRFGRIINVASLAGLLPGSGGHTLYGAAKAFLIKFSQSLLLENRKANVLTTALCPGFTYTEFHDILGNREKVSRYGKHWWSSAEDVAAAARPVHCGHGQAQQTGRSPDESLAGWGRAWHGGTTDKILSREIESSHDRRNRDPGAICFVAFPRQAALRRFRRYHAGEGLAHR
jgi:short-subunit dehydrogenase